MLYIHGVGHFHPENEITNQFLEELDIGTSDDWIMERTGIRSRRTVLDLGYIRETKNRDVRAVDDAALYSNVELGRRAAEEAIRRAGIDRSEIGMVVAGGVMFIVWLVGRGGLGMGDVKLSAFVGAAVGPAMVPTYLVVGSGLGALAGIALLLRGRDRRSTFAYGPFLAAGAAVAIIAGGPLVA